MILNLRALNVYFLFEQLTEFLFQNSFWVARLHWCTDVHYKYIFIIVFSNKFILHQVCYYLSRLKYYNW